MNEERNSLQMGQNYPSNSNVSKQKREEEHIVIAQGRVAEKKTGIGAMLKESFLAGDARQAREHVFKHIFAPDLRAMLFNGIVAFISVMVFGEDRSKRITGSSNPYYTSTLNFNSNTNYTAYSAKGRNVPDEKRAMHEFNNVVFDTEDEARRIYEFLVDWCKRYDTVSVYKYYEAAKVQNDYTLKDWGWDDLRERDIKVIEFDGGFMPDLPTPINLKTRNRGVQQYGRY